MDRLSKYAPQVLGTTRALAGILFACHGMQKLLGAFGGPLPGTPPAIVWIAGLVELGGGVLLTLGLFARAAAFVSSGLMAVAYFIAHAPRGFWPILNDGELAIAYCWLFLYFAAQGPGAWALDNRRLRGA